MHQIMPAIVIKKKEKPNWKEIAKAALNFDVDTCPCCKTGKMIRMMSFEANAPPLHLIKQSKNMLK